jgi:hypothetical protein
LTGFFAFSKKEPGHVFLERKETLYVNF